mmetsp:Transcript_12494/g.28844  ORF Transcript_12494/g.28844 Transcript_12494/m.28844 type:complete len:213 (-) Transcript_12494:54-692(-)
MQGRVWSSTPHSAIWLSMRFWAWPRIPNPVTSVAAWALCFVMILDAIRLSFDIDRTALCIMDSDSESVKKESSVPFRSTIFSQNLSCPDFSCFFLHSCTLTATCVPRGFVRTRTSPVWAPSELTYSSRVTTDVATPPMIGHGFNTVCPPVTVVSASVQASRKPRTIRFVQIVRCSGDMSREAARSIRTKSQCWTPSAYRSDKTFAAPMRPCR